MDKYLNLLRPIFLCSKGEILNSLVSTHEDVSDLLKRLRQEIDAGDLRLETGQPRVSRRSGCGAATAGIQSGKRRARAKLHPHGVEREIDRAILESKCTAAAASAPASVAGDATGLPLDSRRF